MSERDNVLPFRRVAEPPEPQPIDPIIVGMFFWLMLSAAFAAQQRAARTSDTPPRYQSAERA